MSERSTRGDLVKKTAYATVGLPAHLASQLRERLEGTRQSLETARSRISDEARDALNGWIEEGEKIITSFGERARSLRNDLEQTIQKRADGAKEVGRGITATLMEPIVAIDEIEGVGPAYASKLAEAGVISTRALVERCANHDSIERLAGQTGIGMSLLEKWVASADLTRIKGVGSEHMSLLNALGIGTTDQLSQETPTTLARRAAELGEDISTFGPFPSQETFADWIGQARSLSK
jgi:predicted flap endonuclease-1-like 5' DNA nuclease